MNSVSGTDPTGEAPEFTPSILDALEESGLLRQRISYESRTSASGAVRQVESNRMCSLTRRAYEAVDSGFVLPDPVPNSASFTFYGDVSQSIVGTQNRAELTNNFNAERVRERIEREGGEDREELLEALSRLEDLLESGEILERGALSEFSEVMARNSWFTSPVVSALVGFATQLGS